MAIMKYPSEILANETLVVISDGVSSRSSSLGTVSKLTGELSLSCMGIAMVGISMQQRVSVVPTISCYQVIRPPK